MSTNARKRSLQVHERKVTDEKVLNRLRHWPLKKGKSTGFFQEIKKVLYKGIFDVGQWPSRHSFQFQTWNSELRSQTCLTHTHTNWGFNLYLCRTRTHCNGSAHCVKALTHGACVSFRRTQIYLMSHLCIICTGVFDVKLSFRQKIVT